MVLYPGPGFLSIGSRPSLPKKHFNGLINHYLVLHAGVFSPVHARINNLQEEYVVFCQRKRASVEFLNAAEKETFKYDIII